MHLVMSGSDILGCFKIVLPYLNELLVADVGVTLTDKEKFLLYKPGRKLELQVAAGDQIKQGSAVWTAMAERRRVVMRVDKALWGKTCIAVAVPIVDGDNEIVGAASVQETIDRQEELKEMANKLTDSLSTLASTSQEISAQAQEISAVAQATADTMRASESRVSE
ncbi:MAG TPA: chemotaxis protein, partial [Negativicutes bacterium]|nr:chemotaxis protein [Negativicutes bacterium]